MNKLLEYCEVWLRSKYEELGVDFEKGNVKLSWISSEFITKKLAKEKADGLVVEDSIVGWLLFVLPYKQENLEKQINQSLGLRSRLIREANYTGNAAVDIEKEDLYGSWRVGISWLVNEEAWDCWQQQILELRRESGIAEEISLDSILVKNNDVNAALDQQGFPRLLFSTRALLLRNANEVEKWRSADSRVVEAIRGFADQFNDPLSRKFARELEYKVGSYSEEFNENQTSLNKPSEFKRFKVRNFRNIESMEITSDNSENLSAQAIVLFGPNGTGKTSFSEALTLARFKTSRRLEEFIEDKNAPRSAERYFKNYIAPIKNPDIEPSYSFGESGDQKFEFSNEILAGSAYDGVVLSQEDSIDFVKVNREGLAAKVLKGYSRLAEQVGEWLNYESRNANDKKHFFMRKYGLNSSIKKSETAYNRLAQALLEEQILRPSPEYLDWLRFIARLSMEGSDKASMLSREWDGYPDEVVRRLSSMLEGLQKKEASDSQISQAIFEELKEYDMKSTKSESFRAEIEKNIGKLIDGLETSLEQIEIWGVWLESKKAVKMDVGQGGSELVSEVKMLANLREDVEKQGKALRERVELLSHAKQFLDKHWSEQHSDICPVCESSVNSIDNIVISVQNEASHELVRLRERHVEIQKRIKDLDERIKAAGLAVCPVSEEDQSKLKEWLMPFLSDGGTLEGWLSEKVLREKLKSDLSRMKIIPDSPKPYADASLEAGRLAKEFVTLAQEADSALEGPQAIERVIKEFEKRMEKVLTNHLPETLGKVWLEIMLSLTAARWLLPAMPVMTTRAEQRGKSLTIKLEKSDRLARYILNVAELHVLGLAWFFTHYLLSKRFEEAWLLLDDPAQEMDQPSFREFVRFIETLIRIHNTQRKPLTCIVALHQEERALDLARATNARLYVLGWNKEQSERSPNPSVKKIVLMAPGFHPLKPKLIFEIA